MMCPCKGCNSRNGECHSSCLLYRKWKNEHEKQRKEIAKKNIFGSSRAKWIKTQQGYWRLKK